MDRSAKACLIPKINPFDPVAMKLVKEMRPLHCKMKKRAVLQGGYLKITDPSVISASYQEVIRPSGDDFNATLGKTKELSLSDKNIPVNEEFIQVKLEASDGKTYTEYHLQAVSRDEIKSRTKATNELKLSVLIIGIDSTSNAHAQRKLPKSFTYLKERLESYIFMGHSAVGDGTTEQLAALLTGKGERDYPEARRKMEGAITVDGWDWIFKHAREKGYVTSLSEDSPSFAAFNYRLTGFQNPPTDYYPRAFYMTAHESQDNEKDPHCIGGQKIYDYHFDLAWRLYEEYPERPKFLFHFLSDIGHNDFNKVQRMDDDLLRFMIKFKDRGYLDNTVFILMGDHGLRYGEFRETVQGKLEERLPLFIMTFPKWFKEKYPKLAKNLETNTNRLTSWYDGYATFKHLLEYPQVQKELKHGVSLLTELPIGRTCNDASIPGHWCPCVSWSEIEPNHNHVQGGVSAAVKYINGLISAEAVAIEKCVKLEFGKVSFAEVETPSSTVLRFLGTSDRDGYVPNFGKATRMKNVCHYRLTFTTLPSNAVYEANVNYVYGRYVVESGVSRINAYADQPKCIADTLPHFRKFCYCRTK